MEVQVPAEQIEKAVDERLQRLSRTVRLKGWFKPQLSVAISRNRQGYVATWLGGVVLVDNKPMNGRHELKHGDLLDVCGLLLEFTNLPVGVTADSGARPPAAPPAGA